MALEGYAFSFAWETALIVWLQARMGAAGTAAASFFTMFGEEIVCIAVLGFLYWCRDKEFGKFVGRNVLVAAVLNPMIKNVFLRRRPYFDHPEILCLRPVEAGADLYDLSAQGYSFPSGHSSNAVTVFSSLALYGKKKILAAAGIVIPLLVGVSRFCLGVHYPTDVLCGWLLGLAVIFLVPFLDRKIRNRRIFYGLLLLIAFPGFFYCRSEDYFTGFGLLAGFIAASVFEEKFVNFKNTRSPLRCLLRITGGVAVYLGLNYLLKLPFSESFLDSGTLAAYAVRSLRYAVIIFTDIGLYPMLFRRADAYFAARGIF